MINKQLILFYKNIRFGFKMFVLNGGVGKITITFVMILITEICELSCSKRKICKEESGVSFFKNWMTPTFSVDLFSGLRLQKG